MFGFIRTFFTRVRTAWKLTSDPNLVERLRRFKVFEEKLVAEEEYRKQLQGVATELIFRLYEEPKEARTHLPDPSTLAVQFECKEVITSEEADRVLEESRRGFQIPHGHDAQKALRAHNKKFHEKPYNQRGDLFNGHNLS